MRRIEVYTTVAPVLLASTGLLAVPLWLIACPYKTGKEYELQDIGRSCLLGIGGFAVYFIVKLVLSCLKVKSRLGYYTLCVTSGMLEDSIKLGFLTILALPQRDQSGRVLDGSLILNWKLSYIFALSWSVAEVIGFIFSLSCMFEAEREDSTVEICSAQNDEESPMLTQTQLMALEESELQACKSLPTLANSKRNIHHIPRHKSSQPIVYGNRYGHRSADAKTSQPLSRGSSATRKGKTHDRKDTSDQRCAKRDSNVSFTMEDCYKSYINNKNNGFYSSSTVTRNYGSTQDLTGYYGRAAGNGIIPYTTQDDQTSSSSSSLFDRTSVDSDNILHSSDVESIFELSRDSALAGSTHFGRLLSLFDISVENVSCVYPIWWRSSSILLNIGLVFLLSLIFMSTTTDSTVVGLVSRHKWLYIVIAAFSLLVRGAIKSLFFASHARGNPRRHLIMFSALSSGLSLSVCLLGVASLIF